MIARRVATLPRQRGDLVAKLFEMDTPSVVGDARQWLKDADESTQFWAAMILLRHGDHSKREGLAPLQKLLAADDGSYLYPAAVQELIESKVPGALALAVGILKKPRFDLSYAQSSNILRLLVLAGRREAFDFVSAGLDDAGPGGSVTATVNGASVSRTLTRGDNIASLIADWRGASDDYDTLLPDDQRRAARAAIKRWLGEEFALIRAHKPHHLRPVTSAHRAPGWELDAP